MKTLAILVGCLAIAGCASQADQQRQWRLYAVDKCEPMRSSGTPAFDRCVEETMSKCQADHSGCKP